MTSTQGGEILHAERVLKSDKLLKLQVDLRTEQRQIVAGIRKKYTPEKLPYHLTIAVVANLKPAKLMGGRITRHGPGGG
ncbi:MAG: hypothetical protein AB7P17_11805 [Nitrospirales bacterium]|nr:hypothetical protein [Nitrospirales bacterium]